ncbi:hypothetical protein [Legionella fallonii]|uniref:Uncharacterized protein n=1 Tax=Legionella fallonii LLAP-10 TaxID=1212491 RepID=A0A098G7S1_9GAMM|nr:hypothetical protein [Legionella fallonii]CEG58502.1 conserved protein of unknown function [Legionella fallonii LLAP-10]
MTLVLKEFDFLKKDLDDTVKVIWHDKIKNKEMPKDPIIEELIVEIPEERRRNELLFLKGVMNELEKRIREDRPEDLTPYIDIYYGALYVVKEHMRKNLGRLENLGLLEKRLNKGIGLSETNTPDNYQLATFYSSINAFLKLLFKDNDSRNNLALSNVAGNPMSKIPLEKLGEIIDISYVLEEETRHNITKSYLGDGTTEANAAHYHAPIDIPDSAIRQFASFEELLGALEELNLKEIGDKKKSDISEITDEDRKRQLHILKEVSKQLASNETISEKEKTGILAGFMLMVREETGQKEYSKAPFDAEIIPPTIIANSPVVHTELTKILNVKEMSREDAEALITSARNFMAFMTIQPNAAESTIKESVRAKHLFSGIAGFDLVATLNFMSTLIKDARSHALNRCINKHTKDIEASLPVKPNPIYAACISTLGWFAKKPTPTASTSLPEDDFDASLNNDEPTHDEESKEPVSTLTDTTPPTECRI